MASSSSKPKPWVQTARASTNDPRSVVRFIERRLLNDGTIELANPRSGRITRPSSPPGRAEIWATVDRFTPAVRLPGQT
jgi:hypothetical protein